MSVINPNETAKSWRAHKRETSVQLYLSGADGDAAWSAVGASALESEGRRMLMRAGPV